MATGIVKDPVFLKHHPDGWHIESPERLDVLYRMLDAEENTGSYPLIPARRAGVEELHLIHSPDHVVRMRETSGRDLTILDGDTSTSRGSFEAALCAAGSLCEAVSSVYSGLLDNAMALVRPPGHHAEWNRAMGFCLFNNVAVAAAYARKILGIERVLVVDWDVHHGNGTQHAFEDDKSVLYFSAHRYPFFPGTGAAEEKGFGGGEGYTVNVPMPAGSGDGDYAGVFSHILTPIAAEFQPGLILVSAGFDSHRRDPLGGMAMSEKGFAYLTRSVMDMATESCGGKVVFALEGGYDLDALRDSVACVLDELTGASETRGIELPARSPGRLYERIYSIHGKRWKNLGDTLISL